MHGSDPLRKSAITLVLALVISAPALAIERNSSTNKFNWGDDLSETTESPGGINQTSRPPSQFKTNHIPDIKSAIDLSVSACGISSSVWGQADTQSLSQIGYPGSSVKASQINSLRRAIEALYSARSNPNISNYFTGSVAPGEPITKRHVNDMRRALDDLVVGCSGATGTSCEPNISWGGGSCDGIVNGSTADGAAYCATCQCSGTFYRSTLTCNSGNWNESPSSSWWCFLGETMVTMADGTSKTVAELKEGDEVPGKDGTNRVTSVAVRKTSETVYGFNGGKKFVTGGHPFWTKEGWKAIDPSLTPSELHSVHTEKLLVGDELWLNDGGRFKIGSIDAENSGEHTVYSPLVDGDHTYYADGLLVHNKSTDCPLVMSINSGPCVAICGNFSVESGEQCDDGNTANGDGCSSTCQTESACLPDGTVTRTMNNLDPPVMLTQNDNPSCCIGFEQCQDWQCVCGYIGGDICSPPNCDSFELGWTNGGTCGCGNPNGSIVETIGFGCRRYQCDNGVWRDVGAPALCQEAASCA